MGVTAGKSASVKISGTSTVFGDEACTAVSGTTYRIDDATKRVWDRAVPVVVEVDASVVTPTAVDHLRGTVTVAVAGVVTVSGQYLAMTEHGTSQGYDASWEQEVLTSTSFANNAGWTRRGLVGLYDASASLSLQWDSADTALQDALENGTPLVLEFYPDGVGATSTADIGWFKCTSQPTSESVEGVVEQTLDFALDGDGVGKSFSLAGINIA